MSGVWRVREKSKKMKDLPLSFSLLLMGSYKFRWHTMHGEEFCSSKLGNSFPSSSWNKSSLKMGRHDCGSSTRRGSQMGSLDLNFKFIYILKEDWEWEAELYFPFLFRSVTLKYSYSKLRLKKIICHHENSKKKISFFDKLSKNRKT